MPQITLSLDLSQLNPRRHQALMDLVQSLREPYVIPAHELEVDEPMTQ